MSIQKYFKPVPKTSHELLKELPDPNGTLSKTVPSSAIKSANDEVSKAVEGVLGITQPAILNFRYYHLIIVFRGD